MDGFFLSIFLAVCVVVAVLMRCICYRSSCVRRVLTNNDDAILPHRAAPVITPSRSQQQLQHNPQLPDTITDSPIIPHNGAVFTIYTFEQQPSPLLQRSSRVVDPPKYSSLPADSPPKYEDLFPMVELCTSCKVNMSLPPVPLHDLHPVHTPASSNSSTVPGVTTCSAHIPCSNHITNSAHISSSIIGSVNNSSSTTSLASNSSSPTRLAHTSSTTGAALITDAAVSNSSPPNTRSNLTHTASAHNTRSTSSTLASTTVHSHTHTSGPSEEDSPLDTTFSQPSDGE